MKKSIFRDNAYGTKPKDIIDNDRKSIGKHLTQVVDPLRQNDNISSGMTNNMMSASERDFVS